MIARKAIPNRLKEAEAVYKGITVLGRQVRQFDSVEGITPERLGVLDVICKRGPVSVGALADEMCVRPATMSRMISAIDSDGLIQRTPDKNDGRGMLISLSAKGRRAFIRANERSLQRLEESLRNLSEEEIDSLMELGKALKSFYS